MGLETGTYIDSLNPVNPDSQDKRYEGDNHFTLIKSTIKNTFPNITGAITAVHGDINLLTGLAAAGAKLMPGKAGTTRMLFMNAAADLPYDWAVVAGFDDRNIVIDNAAGGTTGGTKSPVSFTVEGDTDYAVTGISLQDPAGDETVGAPDIYGSRTVAGSGHGHGITEPNAGQGHLHSFTSDAVALKYAKAVIAGLAA